MARRQPSQERSRETVEVILEAVSRVARETRIEGITGSRVCAVAGVSPGTLYQYFPTVEDLVSAWEVRALERASERLAQRLQLALEEGRKAEQAGDASSDVLERTIVDLVTLGLELLREHLAHYANPGELKLFQSTSERREVVNRYAQMAANTFLMARQRERFLPADLHLAARLIVNTVSSAACDVPPSFPPEEVRAYDRELARMVARYMVRDARV